MLNSFSREDGRPAGRFGGLGGQIFNIVRRSSWPFTELISRRRNLNGRRCNDHVKSGRGIKSKRILKWETNRHHHHDCNRWNYRSIEWWWPELQKGSNQPKRKKTTGKKGGQVRFDFLAPNLVRPGRKGKKGQGSKVTCWLDNLNRFSKHSIINTVYGTVSVRISILFFLSFFWLYRLGKKRPVTL